MTATFSVLSTFTTIVGTITSSVENVDEGAAALGVKAKSVFGSVVNSFFANLERCKTNGMKTKRGLVFVGSVVVIEKSLFYLSVSFFS